MKEKGVSLQLFIVLLLAAWSMSVKSQTMLIRMSPYGKTMYGYRVDGKPGREIQLDYIGGKLTKAIIKVEVDGKRDNNLKAIS